jgi:hypothetical protein
MLTKILQIIIMLQYLNIEHYYKRFQKLTSSRENLEAPSASPQEKVQRFVLKNNPKLADTPKEAGSQQIQRSGKCLNIKNMICYDGPFPSIPSARNHCQRKVG